MSIRYYKLFDLLNRRGLMKSDLRHILSSATVAKLSKGEYISGEAIEKICRFLDCQPGDIMEVVSDPDPNEPLITKERLDALWNEYDIFTQDMDRQEFDNMILRGHYLKYNKKTREIEVSPRLAKDLKALWQRIGEEELLKETLKRNANNTRNDKEADE